MQYGLGSRISVEDSVAHIVDDFDETLMMAGSGTDEDPFVITCAPHLYNLSIESTKFSTFQKYTGAVFHQYADISLKDASYYHDHTYGWTPISNDPNYPFTGTYDGNGHTLSNMYCHRDDSFGVGLFGFLCNATVINLNIKNADIRGSIAIGGVAGYIISRAGERDSTLIENCTVSRCTISGIGNSISAGGIVGAIDMYAIGTISNCSSEENTITADYNAGGIAGGSSAYSTTFIDLCNNSSSVTARFAGCGGIIGVADTLNVTTSVNTGTISGAVQYVGADGTMSRGTGGICGGSGISYFSACRNLGMVSGYDGVGGIIGSARLGGGTDSPLIYNSILLRYCENIGDIKGESSYVGGLCGEAQFGCFGSINRGTVTGKNNVGGIVGNTGIAVIHNTINTGAVTGDSYVAGVTGQSSMGIYAVCQNYGAITGGGHHTAGITGLTGNNTLMHYCGNHNTIKGTSSPTGGIVGEIGDPREWSVMNYVECIFGALECVTSFIGPVFAAVEHFSGSAKIGLKITEFGVESIMKTTSMGLLSHSKGHLEHEHVIETLTAKIEAQMSDDINAITNSLNSYRKSFHYSLPESFHSKCGRMTGYSQSIVDLSDFITAGDGTGPNNEIFNNRLNETMAERAETIAAMNYNKEFLFQIVGAITLITTTACAIATTVASGGTAVILLGTGWLAGVAGGINSMSKGASDFTDNVIILSQCINTGDIACEHVSDDAVGGIGGIIYDRGWIHDCLNSGNGPAKGGALVGKFGAEHEFTNCLSIADKSTWDNELVGNNSSVHSNESGLYYYGDSNDDESLSLEELSSVSSFQGWDFDNTDGLWNMYTPCSGNTFPVPYRSEMTK